MGSNVGTRMAIGTLPGTGAEIEVALDFEPRKVEILNVDGLASGVWTDTMPADSVLKQITAGTMTFETSGGITRVEQQELDDGASPARGFLIGADADLNASAEDIHWVAYE